MSEETPAQKKEVPRTIGGFIRFIGREILLQRKWILLPVWILLCAAALIIVLGGSSALLPVIYIAF